MVWTILKGPLWSFLSTSHHTHLPSHTRLWHWCRESNELVLPWLRFASRSLLQIFIKVGSLVALLLSISLHMFRGHHGSMQQQDYSSSKCNSHIITSFMSNLVCLKHQIFGSTSLKALAISWIFDLDDCITTQICTKAHLPWFFY